MRKCKYFVNTGRKSFDATWLAWTRDADGDPCGILETVDCGITVVLCDNIEFVDGLNYKSTFPVDNKDEE